MVDTPIYNYGGETVVREIQGRSQVDPGLVNGPLWFKKF
jgi:hypothetical protein